MIDWKPLFHIIFHLCCNDEDHLSMTNDSIYWCPTANHDNNDTLLPYLTRTKHQQWNYNDTKPENCAEREMVMMIFLTLLLAFLIPHQTTNLIPDLQTIFDLQYCRKILTSAWIIQCMCRISYLNALSICFGKNANQYPNQKIGSEEFCGNIFGW